VTTFDLRSLPRDDRGRLLVGEGSFFAASRDGGRLVTFSREPSLQERIYRFVADSGRAVTRAEIAKALGLVKATWLNKHIEALVAEGYLQRQQGTWTNGVVMYRYEVKR